MAASDDGKGFRAYKQRYAILITVVLLNISNTALWGTYSPVASKVANFYEVPTARVNLFPLSYIVLSLPFSFLSTFIVNKLGLKSGIHLGSALNCLGAIIKAFGSSAAISNPSTQFDISLAGQIIAAMGHCFIIFIPTKVSQLWFPEDQRAAATSILAMSNPLGVVFAQTVTPYIVQSPEDVPLNNYILCGLAILAQILTLLCVTRAKPKTPPSVSAESGELDRAPYLSQLSSLFTSLQYWYLLMSLGVGIALFNTIATLTQQLLCPLGYSDAIGGTANTLMVIMGFVGSAVTGILADKTKLFGEITKVFLGFAAFFSIFMFEFILWPNYEAAIVIFYSLFGFFGVGAYPVGLELAVELTYPVEESMSTAFIFVAGEIHCAVAIFLIPAIAGTQDPSTLYLNICDNELDNKPKDYKLPVMIVMCYFTIAICTMIIFLDSRYKRHEADSAKKNTSNADICKDIQLSNSPFESKDDINSFITMTKL